MMTRRPIDIPVRDIKEISLHDNHAASPSPVQVCRTCIHRGDRLWDADPVAVQTARRAGDNPVAMVGCRPSDLRHWFKLARVDGRFRLVSGSDPGRPHAMIETCGQAIQAICRNCANFRPVTVPVSYEAYAGGPTRYWSYTVGGSCALPAEGIEVNGTTVFCAPKALGPAQESSCLNCEFCMRAGTNLMIDDGTQHEVIKADLDAYEMFMTRRQAMLGGHNVAEAIQNARHRLTAHPEGVYLWFSVQIVDTIIRTMPTRHMVRPAVGPTTEEITMDPVITGYRVRFSTGTEATIPAHDDVLSVYPHADGQRGQVQIMVPHHVQFGLTLTDTVALPAYPPLPDARVYNHRANCQRCARIADRALPGEVPEPCELHSQGFGTQHDPLPWRPELINERCAAKGRAGDANCCDLRRQRACLFHGRDPIRRDDEVVVFRRPSTTDYADANVQREVYLRVVDYNGSPRVVMSDGSRLNVRLFEAEIHGLMAQARTRSEALAIHGQLVAARHSLPRRYRMATREIGYGVPLGVESFKPFCALALARVDTKYDQQTQRWVTRHVEAKESSPWDGFGRENEMFNEKTPGLNFRDVMGDRFGVRNNNMSWADQLALNERVRATNPLERFQEEIMVNEAIAYTRRVQDGLAHPVRIGRFEGMRVGYEHWESFRPTSYTYVTPTMDKPAEEWSVEDPDTDEDLPTLRAKARASYTAWLDQTETITQENPDGSTRQVVLSHRWLHHGYDNGRMARTRSRWDVADVFRFDHERSRDDVEQGEAHHGFQCPFCESWYEVTTVVGSEGDARCPKDQFPLVFMEDDHEDKRSVNVMHLPDVPRHRRGVGTAVAADSQQYQTQTMLSRMQCPGWVLKGSSPLKPRTLPRSEREQ